MKAMAGKLVKKAFRQSWQFKLKIDGEPTDFELYVKDITYGPTEVSTEPEQYGGQSFVWPTGLVGVELSMTLRDDENETVAKWIDSWASKVVNLDGTVNLVGEYAKKVERYSVAMDSAAETLMNTWYMYPIRRGDMTESYEEGGHLEFQATFAQFRTNDARGVTGIGG